MAKPGIVMFDPRTSQFWRLALQSGLVDARGLTDSWESIPPERRSPQNVDRRLARQAIQLNLLTLWQAQQLLAGRFNGFKIGRYVLMDLIGQGGMGRVYLAKDSRLDRTVALKILSADRMKSPRAILRFQREAKVGAQLQHENLVRLYDFGESDGRHFLVMEYIEGRTIGAMISQQGPVPAAVAADLGRQIALGLEHAHKKGLVHRDVNPYNVLVTHDGTAKLADLGLALDLADADRFTRDGATVGTFDYVAPEQARHSHSVDIRSDIYSLGCTLYHMIAAEVPFPTLSLPEKIFAHQNVEPTPLNLRVPGLPDGLAEGVGRMMSKSPGDRFSTPLQVAQMLEPFLDSLTRADPGESAALTREVARHGSQAKTIMIPRVDSVPGAGQMTVPGPASDRQTAEASSSGWYQNPGRTSSTPGPDPASPSSGTEFASDPDLPLMLDLGPEPSLREVLAESRTLPRSRPSSGSSSVIWWPGVRAIELWHGLRTRLAARRLQAIEVWRDVTSRLDPRQVPGGIVPAVSAAAIASVLLWVWMGQPFPEIGSGSPPGASPGGSVPATDVGDESNPGDEKVGKPGTTPSNPESPPPIVVPLSPIVVRSFDKSFADIPVKTLSEAINQALGKRGLVVFRNQKPLQLKNDSLIQVNLGGSLTIRAEEGIEPVLDITLNSPGPFLMTGPNLSLELDGLTVLVRAPTAPPGSTPPERSPLIQAAGPITVRRCDFKASGSPTDALFSDGGSLTVERSRFEGFSRAIEIRIFRKLAATIRQTMIGPGSTGLDEPARPPSSVWGLKISHLPASTGEASGDPTGLQLLLDHCTFQGAGLLKLAGFSERSPLRVKASDCIIGTDALIDWDPTGGDPSWSGRSMPWSGKGNRYELGGKSWIVREGSASAPSAIADLASWSKLVEEKPSADGQDPGASPTLIGPSSPIEP